MAAKKRARKANANTARKTQAKRKAPATKSNKSSWVEDLKSRAGAPRTQAPSEEAIEQIREIVAFNDRQSARSERISMGDTIAGLQEHYGYKGETVAFRNWFKRYFGRGWEA